MTQPDCVCGCSWDIHQHYRANDDCGRCGRPVCRSYRQPRTSLADWLWSVRAGLAMWLTRR